MVTAARLSALTLSRFMMALIPLRMPSMLALAVCNGICRPLRKASLFSQFTPLAVTATAGLTTKREKMTTTIQNSNDLFSYLVTQANSGTKNWFGFHQQRIAGINIAYEIAKYHADKMSPEEVAEYAKRLNDAIYDKMIRPVI